MIQRTPGFLMTPPTLPRGGAPTVPSAPPAPAATAPMTIAVPQTAGEVGVKAKEVLSSFWGALKNFFSTVSPHVVEAFKLMGANVKALIAGRPA